MGKYIYEFTTQEQIRSEFWRVNPELKKKFYKYKKRQNDYNADVRFAFIDFVDYLVKSELISKNLAYRVTL